MRLYLPLSTESECNQLHLVKNKPSKILQPLYKTVLVAVELVVVVVTHWRWQDSVETKLYCLHALAESNYYYC